MTDRAASQCQGKIPYASKAAALKAVGRMRKRTSPPRVYICPHCHKFHIGRDEKGKRK